MSTVKRYTQKLRIKVKKYRKKLVTTVQRPGEGQLYGGSVQIQYLRHAYHGGWPHVTSN